MVNPGKCALGAVRYMAMYLEVHTQRVVALAVKTGVAQRAYYYGVVVAHLTGTLKHVGAGVAVDKFGVSIGAAVGVSVGPMAGSWSKAGSDVLVPIGEAIAVETGLISASGKAVELATGPNVAEGTGAAGADGAEPQPGKETVMTNPAPAAAVTLRKARRLTIDLQLI